MARNHLKRVVKNDHTFDSVKHMNGHFRDTRGLGPEHKINGLLFLELHLFRPVVLNYRFLVNITGGFL
ncbi:MAG: hypothetical protein WC635_06235 [Bacteriovorax sp.]|jgi:hypothetical protein